MALNSHSSNSPYYDELAIKLGGLDPFSVPQNSTNTVLEHVFYTGSLDGIVTYPQSSDQVAVLKVSVTGSGSGRLVIGDKVVPLIPSTSSQMARALPSPTTLLVELIKGVTHKILFFGDASLNILFQSDDFAFGNIAFTGMHKDIGYINFPNTVATIPCIHDFNARKTNVYLPASEGANSLIATWQGNDKIEVENHHPRSALITGNFSAKETRGITYTLSHPLYLFRQTVFNQIVRFCPVPPPEEDSEDGDYPAEPPWYTDGDGDNSDENDDEHDEHWCCYWRECGEWCDCGCDCLPDEDGSFENGIFSCWFRVPGSQLQVSGSQFPRSPLQPITLHHASLVLKIDNGNYGYWQHFHILSTVALAKVNGNIPHRPQINTNLICENL